MTVSDDRELEGGSPTRFHRRRIALLALVLFAAFASIAAFGWLARPTGSAPTPEQLRAVSPGMTRAQVRAAVGAAPGEYPRGTSHFHRVGVYVGDEVWKCSGRELHVWYGADGRVRDAAVYREGEAPPARFRPRPLRGR